jgi:energy-coupling factor transporter transmembrane protein EcfT
MVRTFIQVIALLLMAISAFFLIKSIIRVTPKDMAKLSQTRCGYSLPVTRNFAKQKADTVVGFVLLLSGLVFSLANLLWPMRIGDFGVNRNGVILAVLASVIIFLAAYKVSNVLQQHYYKQAEKILTAEK